MTRSYAALVIGPLLFAAALILPPPAGMAEPAWRVAGTAGWLATWWLTGVIPLEATSLLPIVLLPLAGVGTVAEVTASYGDPIIYLFLGGFFLAATLERWDLHRRFALATVRTVGTDQRRVVLAFMLASAAASMWISNTATVVMMLPIGLAVIRGAERQSGALPRGPSAASGFPTALMLGIAYAASIGGVATLIGTPPNAIFAGATRELLGREVTFAGWMLIGLPIAVPMLAICWLVLLRVFRVSGPVPGLAAAVEREYTSLGGFKPGERFVISVFALTALAWVFRAPKTIGALRIPGLADLIPGVSDAQIAIAAALVLFTIPLPRARFRVALDWDSARRVPWGILLLFGGGLALAAAFESSGLTEWVGGRLAGLRGIPFPLVVLTTALLFLALTELTSNTATSALGMPLVVGAARGLGLPAFPLMATVALASSMAFMLPVATPPNAIVFGSGAVSGHDMLRAGIRLVAFSMAIITVAMWVWTG